MALFHKHVWTEFQSQTFKPTHHVGDAPGRAMHANEVKAVFGFTLVTQRCEKCGKLKQVELIGQVK